MEWRRTEFGDRMAAPVSSGGTCFVIASLRAGGAERSIARLAEHRRARERVVLITLDSSSNDFYSLSPTVERIALGVLSQSGNGVRRGVAAARRILLLRRAIIRADCAKVVGFVDRTNIIVLAATLGLGRTVVVSERVNPEFSPIGFLWNVARRIAYKWASMVVVQSDSAARWARNLVPDRRVVIIHNGIGAGDVLGHSRDRTIVAAGRLVPQKGFALLIKAFALATQTDRTWNLIILGDGPERDRLVSLADRHAVGERTSFPGIVRDTGDFFNRSGIFVLSSLFEGFPNVLLEAMAAGCAVIATDCPSGPSDIIRPGIDGILVPVNDVGALSNALMLLMRAPDLRANLGLRAREVSRRFSLQAEFRGWDRVLDSASVYELA